MVLIEGVYKWCGYVKEEATGMGTCYSVTLTAGLDIGGRYVLLGRKPQWAGIQEDRSFSGEPQGLGGRQ
jgi:hypothetical protein